MADIDAPERPSEIDGIDAPAFFTPIFPDPRPKLPNPFSVLYHLYANPVALLTHDHYRQPILANRMFGMRAVFLSDPDYIRYVFASGSARYGLDPIRKLLLKRNFRRGMATVEGEEWKRARKTGASFLDAGHLQRYADDSRAVVNRICSKQPDNQRCDIRRLVSEIIFACAMKCLYSLSDDGSFESIRKTNERYMSEALTVDVMDVMRMPDTLPRVLKRSTKMTSRKLRAKTEALYNRRLQLMKSGKPVPNDLLTQYCSHRTADTHRLEQAAVLDNIGTMMGAAYDTTCNALCWTLYFLSRSPAAMQAVRVEIAGAGLELQSPADWPGALPISLAAVREALRLYPPLPGIVRYALDADEIDGFPVKKGDFIVANIWALQRCERYWINANSFDIDRFVPGKKSNTNMRCYMPFGIGPRSCVGRQFSELVSIIALAKLLEHFEFRHSGRQAPVPVWRGTLRPNGPMVFDVSRKRRSTGAL